MTFPRLSSIYREYNNPGNNDCGFYSYANGLAAVIQRQLASGDGYSRQLELLNQFTTTEAGYTAEQFINYNYDYTSRTLDREFLDKLKSDLRDILYNQYLDEVCHGSVIIEGVSDTVRKSAVYMWFMEIFYYYHQRKPIDKKMNLLYLSPEVCRYAAALATRFRQVDDNAGLEVLVQDHFMLDLFGENHFSKREQWNEAFDDLDPDDKTIVSHFKQFKMLAQDYYEWGHTSRLVDPDFEFGIEAKLCAEQMGEIKNQLLHRQVKIVLGAYLRSQDKIEPETLYFQINSETKQIMVYSPYLDKGYELINSKAENVFAIIRRNRFNYDANNEIIISCDNQENFRQIAAIANDTLNEQLIYKNIEEFFLNLYPEHLRFEVKELITSLRVNSLSREEKEELRSGKSLNLREQVQANSIIYKALSTLRTRQWLATDQDLKYLAELFEVHLETLENGAASTRSQGPNIYNRPTITVNNINNFHWTTKIRIGYLAGEDALKYYEWSFKNLSLTKKEIKNLLLSYTTGFKSIFGRTHLEKARELLNDCDNEQSTVAQIMDKFRDYMYAQQYDPRSSFFKRFEYLDARDRNFKNDLFNKRDIERIFANYAYTGCNRHHLPKAQSIIADCKNPDRTLENVYESIADYVRDNEFNHDSAFLLCWEKVQQFYLAEEQDESLEPSSCCFS